MNNSCRNVYINSSYYTVRNRFPVNPVNQFNSTAPPFLPVPLKGGTPIISLSKEVIHMDKGKIDFLIDDLMFLVSYYLCGFIVFSFLHQSGN
jgi:hypothetical protein